MDKRYPRGQIVFNLGENKLGEMIELGDHGVFFKEENREETVFVPYNNIRAVEFETIPKELLEDG